MHTQTNMNTHRHTRSGKLELKISEKMSQKTLSTSVAMETKYFSDMLQKSKEMVVFLDSEKQNRIDDSVHKYTPKEMHTSTQ